MALEKKKKWMIWGLVAVVAVVAVVVLRNHQAASTDDTAVLLDGDDDVLAQVNGAPVTRYDLERTIAETLNEDAIHQLDEDGRRRALESVVASRAIARAREAELEPAAREALERKVVRYWEKFLVWQYLHAHVFFEFVI